MFWILSGIFLFPLKLIGFTHFCCRIFYTAYDRWQNWVERKSMSTSVLTDIEKSQAKVRKRQKKANDLCCFEPTRENPPETSLTCAVGDVCPVCQRHCANTVGAGPPLTRDQVVNHWSEQINSQHVHLLATLSGSPSVCVCSYPVRSHQRGPSAPTRWLPSASCH